MSDREMTTPDEALVALAHELVEMEHGARAEQIKALHHLGVVVTLDAHLARARAFSDTQHARIDALSGALCAPPRARQGDTA